MMERLAPGEGVTAEDEAKLAEASKFLYDLFADDRYHFTLFLFTQVDAGIQAGLSTSMPTDMTRAMVLSVFDDEPISEEVIPVQARTLN